MGTRTFGVVDTTFASIDMGSLVMDELSRSNHNFEVQRLTVPGFKDLSAPARRLIDEGCSIVIACGMPGPQPIDEACSHDASIGIQLVQALTGVPVLEVFVHISEALRTDGSIDRERLVSICDDRCRKHARNAIAMMFDQGSLVTSAGTGRRQGGPHAGSLA